MIDPTISLGHLITMVFMVVGFLIAQRITVATLATRIDGMDRDITEIQNALKTVADQKGRIDVIDERILAQGRRIDDYIRRHGS